MSVALHLVRAGNNAIAERVRCDRLWLFDSPPSTEVSGGGHLSCRHNSASGGHWHGGWRSLARGPMVTVAIGTIRPAASSCGARALTRFKTMNGAIR